MSSFIQLLITIFETIKEWISGKKASKKLQQEKTEEAEKTLHEAVESGSLADLQQASIKLKKAKEAL